MSGSWRAKLEGAVRRSAGASAVDHQGSFLVLVKALSSATSLLISVLVVRLFGLDAAGTLAIAMFSWSLLTPLASMGLQSSLPRSGLSVGQNGTIAIGWSLAQVPLIALLAIVYAMFVAARGTETWIVALLAFGSSFNGFRTVLMALLVMENRASAAIAPTVATAVAIGFGAWRATTLLEFTGSVVGAWALGHVWLAFRVPTARVSLQTAIREAREGARYLPADVLNAAGDETGPILLARLLSREAIGLLGLARQFVRMAELLAWSLGQSWYIRMVNDRSLEAQLLRAVRAVGMCVAPAAIAASAGFAFLLYRLPILLPLSAILIASVPSRYALVLFDLILRARGRADLCTKLSCWKLIASLVTVPVLGVLVGVWGATVGLALVPIALERVYVWTWKKLPPA